MLLSIKKSAYGIYEWPFSDYHNFSNHVEHYHGFNRQCNFPNCDVGSKSIQEFVQHHVRHTGQLGCGILKMVGPKKQDFCPRINIIK